MTKRRHVPEKAVLINFSGKKKFKHVCKLKKKERTNVQQEHKDK